MTSFFICSAWLYVKELEKIIARMHCFMHQSFFRPNYIFNNNAYFLDSCAQLFPLIFCDLFMLRPEYAHAPGAYQGQLNTVPAVKRTVMYHIKGCVK